MSAPAPQPQASDRCPRCGGGFHCGVADAGPCACTTVHLTPALLADLRARYPGCLCLACLVSLADQHQPADRAGPASPA